MVFLLVFLMMAQTSLANGYRVLYPESAIRCGDKEYIGTGSGKVDTQAKCQEICDEDTRGCNTVFAQRIPKRRGNDLFRCLLFSGCSYVMQNDQNQIGATFTKQDQESPRTVANTDYFYDYTGRYGACAKPSDHSTEEQYGMFGSAEIKDAVNMEECQYQCDLMGTCTGYWWLSSPDLQCVVYQEPIEATHTSSGMCHIRTFHPLTPKEHVAKFLKFVPVRLEKLVVLVRRSAKRGKRWCEEAIEDESQAKSSCEEYMSILDALLELPEGGENVKLKFEDVDRKGRPLYDVGDNAIKVVAEQLRALKAFENKAARDQNSEGEPNKHVAAIFGHAARFGGLCQNDFLGPLEEITSTDQGVWSPHNINSEKKHDTRNVILLRIVFSSLDNIEEFYWMEPLLFAYHTVAKHYNRHVGYPEPDGSF